MDTLILPIATLLLAIFLLIVYYRRPRIKSDETRIYSKMLVVNFVYAVMAIVVFIYAKTIGTESVIAFMQKIYMILMLVMVVYFLAYNIYIINFKGGLTKKLIFILKLVSIILGIVIFLTPLYVINEGNIIDGYGLSYDIVFYSMVIYFIAVIITAIMIFKRNESGFVKDIPFICLVVLYLSGLLIRSYYPSVMFENYLFTFVLFVMYFTIENPDVKMINQLLRNQELVESQMEDKSRFLFEMSQDIKQPTNNILGVVNTYDELSSVEKEEAIKIIGDNANELLFKLNNVLNVSSMDASKIKIVNEEYNPKVLLNSIKNMALNAMGEKQIKLNFEVSESLPNKLSGDDVRLKQIIMSVLYNCINHTETGVINVNVDSIVRYDVARLMIKIEDTGIGMDLDTINKILDDNQELNKFDIDKIEQLDVDLKVAIKIIKLLGGNFMIKSDKGRGSTFTIILDQKCEMENLANSKELEKYTSDAFGKKRVLVVDDNKDELFKISDILGKKDININTSMIGKECVDRIRSGELYNLIIIDDELKITSGYSVLKELKTLEKFKVPVIIMLEKDKEHLKEHYIEDGFKDVILKENLTEELDRISNSYL